MKFPTEWTNKIHVPNHQVAGASGAWRFYSVSASKRLFSTLLAVVGVVVFHQLCQLFQHDQWCTSLEITSPHILETTTSQRWIHLWPHQSLHFSVKIGKNKFLQTQPLSVDLLRASDFRQLGTVDVSEQAAKLFVLVTHLVTFNFQMPGSSQPSLRSVGIQCPCTSLGSIVQQPRSLDIFPGFHRRSAFWKRHRKCKMQR